MKKSNALNIVAVICIAVVACASFVWITLASRDWAAWQKPAAGDGEGCC